MYEKPLFSCQSCLHRRLDREILPPIVLPCFLRLEDTQDDESSDDEEEAHCRSNASLSSSDLNEVACVESESLSLYNAQMPVCSTM